MDTSIVAIDKPIGMTSHDVVDALRRITGVQCIGHAGTLDPLAEGVLVVAIGRQATRTLHTVVAQEKEYETTIILGVTSTTDDEEGEKQRIADAAPPALDRVHEVLRSFTGAIQQAVPVYSAVKISGTPAYRLARRGAPVPVRERTVHISTIELLHYHWPELRLRVVCGPGTYIRSLARDIGEELDTGGYVRKLIRTRVGSFIRDRALSLDAFERAWRADPGIPNVPQT